MKRRSFVKTVSATALVPAALTGGASQQSKSAGPSSGSTAAKADDNTHLPKLMGSATASSGAVGLYHVENLTPDAKEKARVLATYPTDYPERPKDTTVAIIGCPHNTYKEILDWGTWVELPWRLF